MAHTPGPWHYQEESDAYTHIVRAPANKFMCQLSQDRSGEAEANARLIAAAPDLLEACKAQQDAIDSLFAMLIIETRSDKPSEAGMRFMPSKSGQPWDALVAGNAAIAKATGGAS